VLGKIFALKRPTWTLLSEHAHVLDYDGQRLLLGISTVGLANTFRRGPHAELVRQALIDVLGVDARVEGIPTPDAAASAPSGEPHPSVTPDNGPGAGAGPGAGRREDSAPPGAAPRAASAGSAPAPQAGDGGWANAAAAPGTGPSWASPDDPGTPARSRLEQARDQVAADGPERAADQRVADDSAASADDEDVEALGEVGRPVIERILGGTVIDEGP